LRSFIEPRGSISVICEPEKSAGGFFILRAPLPASLGRVVARRRALRKAAVPAFEPHLVCAQRGGSADGEPLPVVAGGVVAGAGAIFVAAGRFGLLATVLSFPVRPGSKMMPRITARATAPPMVQGR